MNLHANQEEMQHLGTLWCLCLAVKIQTTASQMSSIELRVTSNRGRNRKRDTAMRCAESKNDLI